MPYLQVKAISDPASDWQRLAADYDSDIHSVQLSLGQVGAEAQPAGIDVPSAPAEWMNPGVEDNKIGYWRGYGMRVPYTV